MAISFSLLTEGTAGADATPDSASITPTANRLVLAGIVIRAEADAGVDQFSVTGNGLTWVRIAEVQFGTNRLGALFRAMGSSPSTGAVSFTYSGAGTPVGSSHIIVEVAGIETSGTNGSGAVGSPTATQTNTSSTNFPGTVSGTFATGDVSYSVCFTMDDTNTMLVPTGFVSIENRTDGETQMAMAFDADQLTDATWAFSTPPSNRAGGTISLIIKVPAGTTITPSVGALALAGIAPTVTNTSSHSRTPVVGSVALTGNAPTVVNTSAHSRTPLVGSLSFSGNAPTLDLGLPAPVTGALVLSGGTPSVITGTVRGPTVGAIAITGNAPTVTRQDTITPSVGALTLSGQLAVIGGQVVISPSAGSLSLAGLNASLTEQLYRAPVVGSVVIAGHAPSVTVSQDGVAQPLVGTLTLQGNVATVTRQDTLTPVVGSAVLQGYAPTVTEASLNHTRTPLEGSLGLTGLAPFISNSGLVQPSILTVRVTGNRRIEVTR